MPGSSRKALVDAIFAASRRTKELSKFRFTPRKDMQMRNASPEKRKELRKIRREQMKELNHAWLRKLATDKAQLREKMTFFWHDHFACRIEHPFGMQDLNNVMRRHALGNFGDLLTAISKHPAMLEYLNNRQNRKAHPNENFARELMELFTLGRGNYSEQDIKEAARAFTGWNFNKEGQFVFRKKQHDFGRKTFRGKTGNFGGEDIIRMLLEDRRTARYISEKLYRFFVNPQLNESHVEQLTKAFYDSNYDIEAVMRTMFMADWFYDNANIGALIKSPVELLVGLMRQLAMDLPEMVPLFKLQMVLGQVLFRPPNVAGWPGDRAWIDSSTLTLRMMLPRVLILSADPDILEAADLMDMGVRKQLRKIKKLNARIDWRQLERDLAGVDTDKFTEQLAFQLLQTPSVDIHPSITASAFSNSGRRKYLQDLYFRLLSLPEYQLC